MKRTIRAILAALLLCALLLTACGESAQKDVPTGDLPQDTQEPAGTAEVGDGQEVLPSPTPEGEETPSPPDGPVTETEEPVAESEEPVVESEEPVVEPPPVRLGETPDAGREYLDKLYFLGDSPIYWMGQFYLHNPGYAEYLIPPSHIWTGPTGTMTLAYYTAIPVVFETGEQMSLREAVERAKPEYLVITLGLNGISFMKEDYFVRIYTEIVEMVQEVSPETRLILSSIFPINTTDYTYWKKAGVSNDKIRAANGWIEQIAADTGTRFINSYEAVVDEDGGLPLEFTLKDGAGIHMNAEGLKKAMDYFRTHAYI